MRHSSRKCDISDVDDDVLKSTQAVEFISKSLGPKSCVSYDLFPEQIKEDYNRFAVVNDIQLEEIQKTGISKDTAKCKNWAIKTFKQWAGN